MAMDVGNFGDLLDKRVTRLFYDRLAQLPDRIPDFYGMETSKDSYERWSQVGDLPDFAQFNGSVTYQDIAQGYDVTAEHLAFSNGLQITRQLYDDDRHGVWERQAPGLAESWQRTRQAEGARMFNLGFSVDTKYYNQTEAVALYSDSHTTTAAGISTTAGFDNRYTGALTAVGVSTLRTQMRGFRGDVANRISVMPNMLLYPPDLADRADEIIKSTQQPDTANNNYNPQGYGRWMGKDWEFLTDTNNWFMMDSDQMKRYLVWFDRIPIEFGRAEEFDTFVAKWRAYARFSYLWLNWRWTAGSEVS